MVLSYDLQSCSSVLAQLIQNNTQRKIFNLKIYLLYSFQNVKAIKYNSANVKKKIDPW